MTSENTSETNKAKAFSKTDVISRLLAMKNGKDLPEFDHNKANDKTYCIEWGIKKGKWITDEIIDRYIEELNGL